ncbi:MAG: DUF4126 domain-containing protein [Candidatus Accumulibacter sp.]|nr:DUF4126 domain-containing protein [Accumulibacter sp.]
MVQSVALAGGMAWGSGLRLYAVVSLAGLLGRFGYLKLPETLQVIQNPWVLGLAGALLVVEFLADKIPAVDSVWDAVQAFIRIPSGALLAALALGEHDPAWMAAAGLLGAAVTAGTQAAKSGSRAIINTSPEPFSNFAVSLGEDALAATSVWVAIVSPVLFLVALIVFIVFLIWFLPRVFRGLRALWNGIFGSDGIPSRIFRKLRGLWNGLFRRSAGRSG